MNHEPQSLLMKKLRHREAAGRGDPSACAPSPPMDCFAALAMTGMDCRASLAMTEHFCPMTARFLRGSGGKILSSRAASSSGPALHPDDEPQNLLMKKLRHREAEGRGDPSAFDRQAGARIAAHHALLVVAITELFCSDGALFRRFMKRPQAVAIHSGVSIARSDGLPRFARNDEELLSTSLAMTEHFSPMPARFFEAQGGGILSSRGAQRRGDPSALGLRSVVDGLTSFAIAGTG